MLVVPEESERCTTWMAWSGRVDAFVDGGDLSVVPLGDLTQEDGGHGVGVELETFHTLQVVGAYYGAEHGGDMQHFGARSGLGGGDLFILHGSVGGAEIDGELGELLDAATGADALVVDLDAFVDHLELTDPLDVERLGEGGAGAVEVGFEGGGRGGGLGGGGGSGFSGSGGGRSGGRLRSRSGGSGRLLVAAADGDHAQERHGYKSHRHEGYETPSVLS